MTIRPILSAMLRNKTGAVLVALQIAITLAVLVNAAFIIQQRIAHINRDSGMDIPNMIAAYSFGFGTEYNHGATVDADLDLLRNMPGVVAVTPTRGVPLSSSGSAQGFSITPEEDAERTTANYYTMDHHAVDTLGITISRGRNFTPEEINRQPEEGDPIRPTKALVTDAFAEKAFGEDSDPIGKLIYFSTGHATEVIGTIRQMHGAWVGWEGLDQVIIFPSIEAGAHMRYLIRTQPGKAEALVPVIEEQLANSNTQRVINRVKTMTEITARSYEGDRAMAIVLTVVMLMLVTVTSLGIVGLAAFSVRQRTKQIGTRRAIGARRADIMIYFLTENWLITTIGVIGGVALTMLLNYHLATEFSLEKLDPVYLPLGVITMWALGLLAVLGPARRAAKISPAVATRTV